MEAAGQYPSASVTREKGRPVSIAIVSLILLVPLAIIGIIIFGVISGKATRRNENRPEGEGPDETRPGKRGPGGEE